MTTGFRGPYGMRRLRLEKDLAQQKQPKLELSEQERIQRIQKTFNGRQSEEGRQVKLDRSFGEYFEKVREDPKKSRC
jgi:hypothetical protein